MVKIYKLLLILLFCSVNAFAQQLKEFECKATYYHNMFENRRTSSGEIFTQKKYTAAHKTLPMHTLVKVTNLSNGRSVLVKVNDRCPKKGVIDLSSKAAKQILLHKTGTAKVKVEILEDDYLDPEEGTRFGYLMNEYFETLAYLPGLCGVEQGQLLFESPDKSIRRTPVYTLLELIDLAM